MAHETRDTIVARAWMLARHRGAMLTLLARDGKRSPLHADRADTLARRLRRDRAASRHALVRLIPDYDWSTQVDTV